MSFFFCFFGFFFFFLNISLSRCIFRETERNLELRASVFPKNEHISGLRRNLVAHTYKSIANVLSYACKDTQRLLKILIYLTPKVSIHGTLLGVWHFTGCSNTTTIAFKYVWNFGLFKSHGLHSHLHLSCVFIHPLAPLELND